MRLLRIELTNFRQFQNEKIDFAVDEKKNVTLIVGDNGSGKTSLAQAFFWCLYGSTSFQDKVLLNRDIGNNLLPNQIATVYVKITLEHERLQYNIIRKQNYKKQYDNSLKPESSQQGISKKDAEGNTTWLGAGKTESAKQAEMDQAINDIIPEDLAKYFFFDGEKIETLSKEISSGRKSSNFVNAVNCLTGLNATKQAMEHLDPNSRSSVIGKLDDEYISGSDAKIRELTNTINEAKNNLNTTNEEIKTIDQQIVVNDEYIKKWSAEIKTYSEAEKLQSDKENQTRMLNEHKWQKLQTLNNIFEKLNRDDVFDRFLCEWPVKEALTVLNSCEVSGKDIPKLHGDTIKYLLKQGLCICGTPLAEHSKERQHLLDLINFLPPESIGTSIGNFIKQMKLKYQDKNHLNVDIYNEYAIILDLDSKIEGCEKEIELISEKLGSNDVSKEVNRLQNNIRTTEANTRTLRNNKSRLEQNIGRYKAIIETKDKERKELASKSAANARIELTKKYAEALYYILKENYSKKEQIVKTNLQNYINENFKQFFDSGIYLQIDNNYSVKVSVSDKFNSLETSTAQGIAVIFSFLAAIIRIAKENNSNTLDDGTKYNETYPVVMDAPLSTLDEKRIKIVCEILPRIADQVIIFIKDTDGKVAEECFSNAIGKKMSFYKINDYITKIN